MMMEELLKIFVVDDDPAARLTATFQLASFDAQVREFSDGEACLAALDDVPDIIVMDIEMPGTDGISICRAIREAKGNQSQIIFASSHDDLETRLSAYDAGGNDYIVKPYAPDELTRKIEVARRVLQDKREVMGQAQYAQQTAFTAMSSMGEMGITQEFLRASFSCQTPNDLAHTLCNALGQYGLQGNVELRDGAAAQCYSTQGACSALEESILSHTRRMERIFQFRDHLVINYPHITILIHNLPLNDPDRSGRLRDHLAVLAEGAGARYQAMLSEAQRIAQAKAVIDAVTQLTRTLEDIDKYQEDHRDQVLGIANEHMASLTHAFLHLGLSEQQEESLAALAQDMINKVIQMESYSIGLSQRLRGVTAQLKAVAGAN